MSRGKSAYQFEDTYAGLSDEEEDAFNDQTFGADIAVGQDFSFGGGSGGGGESAEQQQPPQQTFNYAEAARSKLQPQPMVLNDDPLKPMESLWGDNNSSQQKVFSVDEIESQAANAQHQQSGAQAPGSAPAPGLGSGPVPAPGQFQGQPPFPPNMNYFYPPNFMPPQGYAIPPQFMAGQLPPQQFQQFPPMQQLSPQQPQQQAPPQSTVQQPQQPQQPVPPPPPQQQYQAPQPQQQAPQQERSLEQSSDKMSEFPVLGSQEFNLLKDQTSNHHQNQPQHQEQQQHFQNRSQHNQRSQQFNNQNQHYNQRPRHQYGPQHHENFNELPEEEKQRLIKRQQKVQRILQFTGIMTPRDKDYVTRLQLSHIVTEDPYNEDFYFQVFRLIKTGNAEVSNNNIAQAYLNFSGHRLGGRYQSTDLALQRMQQQVQKAVTVAKERPRQSQVSKEGALGKLTFSSGKTPRKQLELITRPVLPEISKGGKKAILLQIENIYQEMLKLESLQRENKELNTEKLWDSLKLFDQDSSNKLNPFIQLLSYEKGLKIFPRVFLFFDRQQKLTIITLICANLSLIKIISKSSFKNHKDDEIPADVQKTIELFQLVVLKPIILFLSYEATISEIIGLLTILIEHNNVSFLTTSKLGISLITILLSRAEIIKQEQQVSAEDLQYWSTAYDKLFSALETRLPLIFPSSKLRYDDSYIWQFLASLALSGKLNHQRIIVDEIRDEIFGCLNRAKETQDPHAKGLIITNLNLFLNVIGLNANGEEISELK